jgi:hypothetical protein
MDTQSRWIELAYSTIDRTTDPIRIYHYVNLLTLLYKETPKFIRQDLMGYSIISLINLYKDEGMQLLTEWNTDPDFRTKYLIGVQQVLDFQAVLSLAGTNMSGV